MILQTLDVESRCHGVYCKGELKFQNYEREIRESTSAWKYSPILKNYDHKYLFLYTRGRPLREFSKNSELFLKFENLLEAHKKASITAQIKLGEICFFEILPLSLLRKHFAIREEALRELEKEEMTKLEYETLKRSHILAKEISQNHVKFDSGLCSIKYNIFGTKTGRFSTCRDSFPILTLKKEERRKLQPINDLFLEIDYNAAELRTLLCLLGEPQPSGDIHQWNADNIYQGSLSRDDSKKKIFSWLYDSEKKDPLASRVYRRKDLKDKFWHDNAITTPFGRKIPVKEKKWLNYLLQSTTSDIVIESAYKIMQFLKSKNTKTRVSFTLHDSIVLDLDRSDIYLVDKVKEIFSNNRLSTYPCKISAGKNFGEMKELKI